MKHQLRICAWLLVLLMAFPALAQTNTYKWTNPSDKSTTTLSLPSTWAFTGPSGTVTPDGTTSTAPNGAALTTSAGTWSWGQATNSGNYQLLLNGKLNVSSDAAALMEVAHGGQLYAKGLQGSTGIWFVFNGTMFVTSAAP